MELSELLTFALAAMLLVVSPGPNGLLIAKTVPTSGRVAGFVNVAGFAFAFYAHGLLSILGISVILLQSAQLFFIVKMLGAAYLCWIGIQALRDAFYHGKNGIKKHTMAEAAKTSRGLGKAFIEGFLTCVLNPKVSMFYLAVFPQFIPQSFPQGGEAYTAGLTLVAVHSTLNIIWFSAMVVLFGQLVGITKTGVFQRWIKATTGVVFIGFGAKLALLRA